MQDDSVRKIPAGNITDLTDAQVDEAIRLCEQGWSLRTVGRHADVADMANWTPEIKAMSKA